MSRSGADPEPFARLQQQLLAQLHGNEPLEELIRALPTLTDDPTTRTWLASFDPVMLALARELARKWLRP